MGFLVLEAPLYANLARRIKKASIPGNQKLNFVLIMVISLEFLNYREKKATRKREKEKRNINSARE
jgi:hypothetical protein